MTHSKTKLTSHSQSKAKAKAKAHTPIQIINDPAELETHIHELIKLEPKFASVFETVGIPDLRRQANETANDGFVSILRAIVGQQLSGASARAIFSRVEMAGLTTPNAIQQACDDTLRDQGLSKQKIRYIRSLIEHEIDFLELNDLADDAVIAKLTAVTGIGRWTAEMYLLFTLGRADVLAVDDLAIKVAIAHLYELGDRPKPKQARQISEKWSPYRSSASLLLWKYYGWLKDTDALVM